MTDRPAICQDAWDEVDREIAAIVDSDSLAERLMQSVRAGAAIRKAVAAAMHRSSNPSTDGKTGGSPSLFIVDRVSREAHALMETVTREAFDRAALMLIDSEAKRLGTMTLTEFQLVTPQGPIVFRVLSSDDESISSLTAFASSLSLPLINVSDQKAKEKAAKKAETAAKALHALETAQKRYEKAVGAIEPATAAPPLPVAVNG